MCFDVPYDSLACTKVSRRSACRLLFSASLPSFGICTGCGPQGATAVAAVKSAYRCGKCFALVAKCFRNNPIACIQAVGSCWNCAASINELVDVVVNNRPSNYALATITNPLPFPIVYSCQFGSGPLEAPTQLDSGGSNGLYASLASPDTRIYAPINIVFDASLTSPTNDPVRYTLGVNFSPEIDFASSRNHWFEYNGIWLEVRS